jgi:hypothetical protein
MLAPILRQTIVFNCEEAFAFGIGSCGTRIECEPEFSIEPVEQPLGRAPLVFGGRE